MIIEEENVRICEVTFGEAEGITLVLAWRGTAGRRNLHNEQLIILQFHSSLSITVVSTYGMLKREGYTVRIVR